MFAEGKIDHVLRVEAIFTQVMCQDLEVLSINFFLLN